MLFHMESVLVEGKTNARHYTHNVLVPTIQQDNLGPHTADAWNMLLN